MVRDGEARIPKGERRKRIRHIELLNTTDCLPRQHVTEPNLRAYMGQAYTFRERIKNDSGDVVATVTQLKHIDTRDHRVFVQSVLDCLSSPNREQAEAALRAECDRSRRN